MYTKISSTYKPNTHVQVERNPMVVAYKYTPLNHHARKQF